LNQGVPSSDSISASICDGQSYQFGNQFLNTSGIYTRIITNASGCDSTITLQLSVNPVYNDTVTIAICQGTSFPFKGGFVSQAGTYYDTLQSRSGCDSMVMLNVSIKQPTSSFDTVSICAGSTYNFNGSALQLAGNYLDTLVNAAGCDSIINLTLTYKITNRDTIRQTMCQGQFLLFGTKTIRTSGTYYDSLTNAQGCDSIIVLFMNVIPKTAYSYTDTICVGQTYSFGGQTLTNGGNYSYITLNAAGCDSTVSLTLIIISPPSKPIITRVGDTLVSSSSTGNQWYYLTTGAISGATNKTYLPNQSLGGKYFVTVTKRGCATVSSDTIIYFGLSNSSLKLSDWKVYPNPANEQLNITCSFEETGETSLEIYSMDGRKLRSIQYGSLGDQWSASLEVSDLPAGLYLLRLQHGDKTAEAKISILH
jgi:hypothetical protein